MIFDLLYGLSHTVPNTKEANDLARDITHRLGVGKHIVEGRTILVETPLAKDDWVEYRVKELPNEA